MTDRDGKVSEGYSEVFACPPDYVPTRFFQKYNIGFVPPVYRDSLIAIGRSTRVDIVQLWGWTFDRLADRVGIGTDTHAFSRYTHDHRDGNIICASSRVSEVFKSSYLRVLEALEHARLIDRAVLRALSANVCPIDLSFWKIGFSDRPEWWPAASPKSTTLSSIEGWESTGSLALKIIESGQLLYMQGPFVRLEEDPLQESTFQLIPFAYQVSGPAIPDAAHVAKRLIRASWTINPEEKSALSVFNVPLAEWTAEDQHAFQIGDLTFVPLLAKVNVININCWQCERGLHRPVFPSAYLLGEGRASYDEKSWKYVENEEIPFVGRDWVAGPIDRMAKTEIVQHGQFAEIDCKWLDRILAENSFELAFVQEHTYWTRKNDYSDPERSQFFDYLRFVRLIT